MALEEEDEGGGDIPEWVVTFGDMMSLLLTFFIMLVSLSEIKQEERFQAMVESFRKQFGHDRSVLSMTPGRSKPRNSRIAKLASMGRAQRLDLMRGGNKVPAPVGDYKRVRIVRDGHRTAVGTSLQFEPSAAQLSETNRQALRAEALVLGGKPQRIEIRAHTSRRPPDQEDQQWNLAYRRCHHTMRFLVDELKIDARRIRLSVAGPNEPLHIAPDPAKLRENERVDVFLLDEVFTSSQGTEAERQQRFHPTSPNAQTPSTSQPPPNTPTPDTSPARQPPLPSQADVPGVP